MCLLPLTDIIHLFKLESVVGTQKMDLGVTEPPYLFLYPVYIVLFLHLSQINHEAEAEHGLSSHRRCAVKATMQGHPLSLQLLASLPVNLPPPCPDAVSSPRKRMLHTGGAVSEAKGYDLDTERLRDTLGIKTFMPQVMQPRYIFHK